MLTMPCSPAQNSTIAAHINAPPPETLAQKWANLPNTTKYIIYGSVASLILISGALLTWCCISQRRAGRRERVAEEAAIHKRMLDDNSITKDTLELMAHRAELHTGGHGYERGYR
jgi:type II secretory pathway component PulM